MKFLERTHRAKKLSKSLIKSQCILLTPLSPEGDINLKIKGSRFIGYIFQVQTLQDIEKKIYLV